MKEVTRKSARTWSMLGQRGTVCGVALPELMEQDEGIYVLTADLAHLSGLERVQNRFPKRFINVGIAEQNMIGIAAGLAAEGNVVFATTYATFLTMRCFEQVRHHLGYQKMNIKLIGSSAGLAMGMSGNTHYTYEDIAIMRAIPNMTVLSPADAVEAYYAVNYAAKIDGPVYIRLTGGLNEPIVYQNEYTYEIGKSVVLKAGTDIALITTGDMATLAIAVAQRLENDGIAAEVVNMHTIKPLDKRQLKIEEDKKLVVTIEEHSVIGGLGSAVAEYYTKKKNGTRVLTIGIKDEFLHPASREYLLQQTGLNVTDIYEEIRKEL